MVSAELVIATIVTGALGWAVKTLLDRLREYVVESRQWRRSITARLDEQDERSKADSGRLDRIEQRIEFIEKRLDKQEGKIDSTLEAQCTQMRSDITHKIHRYVDDLGCASTEEKQSLWAEYEVYCDICSKHGIENHFVEQMVRAAMDLPDRPKEDS